MFRVGYAVSMHEETVATAHVLHILAEEPFTLGTITRDVGDAYCKPRSHFYDLWDEGIGRPTCQRCLRIATRLEAQRNGEPAFHEETVAIWSVGRNVYYGIPKFGHRQCYKRALGRSLVTEEVKRDEPGIEQKHCVGCGQPLLPHT